jgi:hypothetical protein
MQATLVYAIAAGALAALFVLFFLTSSVLRWIYSSFAFWISKYLFTPQLPYPLRGMTRMHLLLLGGFVIANILGILLEGRTLDGIMIRTGYLALVNAVPLGLTGRCNVFLDKCGVPYETRLQLHRWIGRMVLVHSIVHSAIALGNGATTAITLEKGARTSGYIVSILERKLDLS